jgi:thioredoxin reductase (NADPH)
MKTAIILGGGPAGSQCALWLKMLGLDPLIVEKTNHLGGLQHFNPYQNNWLVGMIHTTGRELAQHIQQHIEDSGISVLLNSTIEDFKAIDRGYSVHIGKQHIETACIVIATGSMPRKENLETQETVAVDAANHDYSERVKSRSVTLRGSKTWQANLPAAFASQGEKLLDKRGFIATDAHCLTPIANIYAIGEVANRMPPCVSTAMADGVVAAKAIQALFE